MTYYNCTVGSQSHPADMFRSLVLVKVLHDAIDVLKVARPVRDQHPVRTRVVGGLD
jgi:hypothetical protein